MDSESQNRVQSLRDQQLPGGGGRSTLGRKLTGNELRNLYSSLQKCRAIMIRALHGSGQNDAVFRPLWQMSEICAKSSRRSDCNPESL